MNVYVLGDDNHEGDEGIYGIFSTLALAEQYQFDHHLGKAFTGLAALQVDNPDYKKYVPQIFRLSAKIEWIMMKEKPNYKEEKLTNAKWFCDDCQKLLTACWDCGYFHCKCQNTTK